MEWEVWGLRFQGWEVKDLGRKGFAFQDLSFQASGLQAAITVISVFVKVTPRMLKDGEIPRARLVRIFSAQRRFRTRCPHDSKC